METFTVRFIHCIVISSLLNVYTAQEVAPKPQYITIYEGERCTGQNQTYLNSTTFAPTSWQFKNSSAAMGMGTWYATTFFNTTDGSESEQYDRAITANGILSNACIRWVTGDDESNFYRLSIQKHGPEDMAQSEIMFYSNIAFKGEITMVDKATNEYSFASAKIISGYIFSGIQNWTIFANVNFTGQENCLSVDHLVQQDGFGLTFKPDLQPKINVGSVRRGCKYIPPTTTTTSTTPSKASNINIMQSFSYLIIVLLLLP